MSYSGLLVSTYGQTIHGGTYIAPANPYYNIATINVFSTMQTANTDMAWDIRFQKYSNRFLSVGTTPTGIWWRPDGSSLTTTTSTGLLSTYKVDWAWNISAVNTSTQVVEYSHPVLGPYGTTIMRDTSVHGVSWGDNGTKLYLTGATKDAVFQFKASESYNVANLEPATSDTVEIYAAYNTQNTIALDQGGYSSVSGRGMYVRPDGTSFYVTDSTSDKVFQYDMSTPFCINTATMVGNTSIAQQSLAGSGLFFRDDGSQMYVMDQTKACMFQWTLGTAWQANTAVCVPQANNAQGWTLDTTSNANLFTNPLNSNAYTPNAMAFSRDGYMLIAADPTSDFIFTYNLATPWNVSTASAWTENRFYSKYIDDTITGLAWQDDGNGLFIMGTTNRQINKVTLSRSWDISTSAVDVVEWGYNAFRFSGRYKDINAGTGETNVTGIQWGDGGNKLYTIGTANDRIVQWNATEAYNVSTLTNSGLYVSTLLADGNPSDFWIRGDGNQMFTLAPANRTVISWDFGSTWDISTAYPSPAPTNANVTGIRYASKTAALTGMTGASFNFSEDGTMLITMVTSTLYSFSLSTAWDITTATAVTSRTLTSAGFNVGAPAAMCVSGNGYDLYVLGTTADRIYWFQMNPYDLSSLTYTAVSFLISAQEGTGTSMFIEPGGSYLYVIGSANDRILKYNFGWGNDLSSLSYAGVGEALSITTFQATPTGICFTPDGTRVVVSGGTSSTQVRQFDLSANPWVPSSNSGATMLSNALQIAPTDIRYGDNGKKFYTISGSGIHQYDVWRDYQWNYTTVETAPTGIYFHGDGYAWWMVGNTNDRVQRFNMSSPWEINTSTRDATQTFLVSSQSTTPTGISFRNDGTEMYISDSGTRQVYVYSLASNAWEFTPTAPVYTGKTLDLGKATNMIEASTGTPTGVLTSQSCFTFNDSGTKAYTFGSASSTTSNYYVAQYDFTRVINVAAQEATPQALFVNGSYACVIGNTTRRIFRYDFTWSWALDGVNYNPDASSPALSATTAFSAITGLTVTNDGRSAYLIGTISPASYMRRYTMPEGSEWNFSTMTLSYTNVATTEIGASPTDMFKSYDNDYNFFVSHGSLVKQFTTYRTLYVGSQDTAPTDFWMHDGDIYVLGTTNDRIFRYSSGWDIDSATYTGSFYTISSQEVNSTGITFSNDGYRMVVAGLTNAYEYRLDEAWNITTARYYSPNNTIGLSTYTAFGSIQSIQLADNDKRLFVSGTNSTTAAFGVGELKFCKHFYIGTQSGAGIEMYWRDDGNYMYIMDQSNRRIYDYRFYVNYVYYEAWNVQAGYFIGLSPQYSSLETSGTAMSFSSDGYHYYVSGTANDTLYQFDMSGQWEVTTPTPTQTKSSVINETAISSLYMANDGKKFWTAGSNTIKEYHMPASLYIGSQASNAYGLTMAGGGDYVYVIDSVTDTIRRYDCPSGYDIATGSYAQASPSVAGQDTNFYGIDIQRNDVGSIFGWANGSTIYLLGAASIIYQYVLPGQYDLTSGMTNNANINISSFENNAKGLRFSWDGYDIFVVGLTTSGTTPTVWRIPFLYARGTGYDHLLYWMVAYDTTARTSVSLQQGGASNSITNPTGVTFSLDGTTMQVCDASTGVYHYQLATPWDITTAVFKTHYNTAWISTSIEDIYMSYNGDRFFTLDRANDRINEFTLGPV